MAVHWQSLASLSKANAALPKEVFAERHPSPFLLELESEQGDLEAGATRAFDVSAVKDGEISPTLQKSKIIYLDGQGFVIGREATCDIQINHDTISEAHCRFDCFGSIWAIKDEGSKNGTFVNGRQLKSNEQSPLKFGTKIRLGSSQFLFLSTEGAFDLIQDLSREPRIRPRSLGKYRSEFKELVTTEAVEAKFRGPFLVIQAPGGRDPAASAKGVDSNTITLTEEDLKKSVNKNVTDAIFDLSNHNLVRIGRATVTQIHLPLGAISNLHAALIRGEDETWKIQDLGAKNGTHLWGERLPPQGCRQIDSGTEVTFGNIKAIFFFAEDLLTYALHRDSLV
ncbi:MAG: FHA domain-containing protein [Planctomycetes bacterium]|nr:FHA domain-containing protein [Planctomycetota bacterium]